jgi:hypothetical protein
MARKTKQCSQCKKIKKISSFNWCVYKNGQQYPQARCKICNSASSTKWIKEHLLNENPDIALKATINQLFYYSKTNAYNKKLDFNLTTEFLLELYKKQNGKCFYTGAQMKLNGIGLNKDPLYISLDKVTPELGYIQGNVVFCCLGINYLKGVHSVDVLYNTLFTFFDGCIITNKLPEIIKEKLECHNN